MKTAMGCGRVSALPQLMYTLNNMYSDSPSYRFNGINECINIPALATQLCNNARNTTGGFEVVFRLTALPGAGLRSTLICLSNNAAPTYFQLYVDENGKVIATLVSAGAAQLTVTTVNNVVTANKVYSVFFTNPGTAGGQKIYINGEDVPVTYAGAAQTAWLSVITANLTCIIGMLRQNGGDNGWFNGEMLKIRCYNRSHTVDEIYKIFLGSPEYSEIGAQMTEHLTAAPGDWAAVGDVTMGAGDADLIGYLFTVAGTSTATEVNGNLNRVLQPYKRYRFIYTVTETVAHDGTLAFDLVVGATVTALDHTAGTHTAEFVAPNTALTDDVVVRFISAGGATVGTYTVGNIRLIEIGCVASYDPSGMTPGRWGDSMQQPEINLSLDSVSAGGLNHAQLFKSKHGHRCQLYFKEITADTTFTDVIPRGYRIESIIVQNTSTNNVTINIDAGVTSLVAAEVLNFGTIVDCTLVNNIVPMTDNLHNLIVTDSGAGWGGAILNITIFLEHFAR